MNIYLIRHGNITRDANKGDYFYRLNEEGIKNVINMCDFINDNCYDKNMNNIILTSNTLRTIETSILLSEKIKEEIEIVNNCHELNMGYNDCKVKKDWKYVLEDGTLTDRKGFSNEEKFRTRHYLGDSPYDVYKRLIELKNRILYYKDRDVYVVGHGVTLRLLLMHLNNYDVNWYYEEPIPENASVRKLVLSNNRILYNSYIWRGK